MEAGWLVGEEIRARLEWTIIKWLGVNHVAILAAANCNGQGQIVKYAPKSDPACWRLKK